MKKNKILFPKKVALLLGAAAVLLLGSTVGSTRAALTYYSENYSAQMNLKHIGVSLVENGQVVSSRDYVSGNEWSGNTEGKLLANMLGENEKFTPGKQYDEAISVTNSGDIDTFVRVIITKSWKDKEGRKNAELSPDLIELNVPENSGWVVAEDQSTPERMVLYYTKALAPGETTPGLSDTIRIDESVAQQVNKVTDGSTVTYQYKYDGYSFNLDAEVDAVQTHNAKAAAFVTLQMYVQSVQRLCMTTMRLNQFVSLMRIRLSSSSTKSTLANREAIRLMKYCIQHM